MKNNWQQIFDNKIQGLVDYIKKYDLQACVIGVSGGIDSSITCAIASEACKKTRIKLIGRSLPTSTNESDERKAAILVGESFCDDFREINIEELTEKTQNFIEYFENMSLGSIPVGNIKARFRMIYLYNLASMYRGIVLDTDNLTEHYMGFFTIHGDQGDLGVLGDLWKTEVFEFGKWMLENFELDSVNDDESLLKYKAIKASLALEPTDGNGTAPDLVQYGAPSFEVVDHNLQSIIQGGFFEIIPGGTVEKLYSRYHNTQFKRWHGPLNVNRTGEVTNAEGETVL